MIKKYNLVDTLFHVNGFSPKTHICTKYALDTQKRYVISNSYSNFQLITSTGNIRKRGDFLCCNYNKNAISLMSKDLVKKIHVHCCIKIHKETKNKSKILK